MPYAALPRSGPAVSEANGKLSVQGGGDSDLSLYQATGSYTIPLGTQFGFQADGLVGSLDDRFEGAVGGHLFWRNPASALLGVYANYGHADALGGIDVGVVAGEAEIYLNRFTLGGIAGYQFGDLEGAVLKLNLDYYVTDDFRLQAGYRYFEAGPGNVASLGAEAALPFARDSGLALFAEGRVGEDNYWSAMGGLRFYFGPGKSLIRRHREDDPGDHFDTFDAAVSNAVQKVGPQGCLPPMEMIAGICELP